MDTPRMRYTVGWIRIVPMLFTSMIRVRPEKHRFR